MKIVQPNFSLYESSKKYNIFHYNNDKNAEKYIKIWKSPRKKKYNPFAWDTNTIWRNFKHEFLFSVFSLVWPNITHDLYHLIGIFCSYFSSNLPLLFLLPLIERGYIFKSNNFCYRLAGIFLYWNLNFQFSSFLVWMTQF